MKIKPNIFLKSTENLVYAMDLESNSPDIFRFEGPAAIFIKGVFNKESPEEIHKLVLETFSDCTAEQVQNDYKNFVESIRDYGFIQS